MTNDDHNSNPGTDRETRQQVLALLNQLGDRLKRAETEREGLREQIREYRDRIQEIEDRAATTEKVYLNIENRLNAYDRSETELREELQDKVRKLDQVEARIPDTSALEKTLLDKIPDTTDLEKKLTEKIPDTAALEKKLTDKIPDTSTLEQRVESAERQARQAEEKADSYANAADKLERRIEQLIDDNTRMSRKLERLEEDVAKTDDALKSRAMVLLTDREAAGQSGRGYLPAGGAYSCNISNNLDNGSIRQFMRLMQRPIVRTAGIIALILAGTGAGWVMNTAVQTGSVGRQGAQMTQKSRQTAIGNIPRATMARMNTTPHKTRDVTGLDKDAGEPEQPSESEPSAQEDTSTGDTQKQARAESRTTMTQKQASATDGGDGDTQQQTASRSATNGPAVRMNASAPSAGKSDRTPSQVPGKELPARLGGIYKQARGAEEAAEDALMADKPAKSLKKRLKPDADLPGRFKKLQEQALNGDARAQHDLAALYTAGRNGVEQDYERAIALFKASARQDVANARYNLGVLYHQGLGVSRDMQKAIRYYRAASLLGHAQARYNLGIAYIQGVGTKYNPRYAAAYFEKAARGGVVEAAYNLGLIYENGLAGKANADLALFWYHHAAENGSGQAEKAMNQIAERLDLSQTDIRQTIKDTDLDVKLSAEPREAETKSKTRTDKQSDSSPDLPGDVKPAFAPSTDPDLVSQIQRQLARFDLYSGETDGNLGPKTRKAIKAYQEMHDLPQTGKSSEDLLVHMLSRSIQDSGDMQSAN